MCQAEMSGEAPGVDVTHKEVKRDTAGRRERNNPLPYSHTDSLPEVTQLDDITIVSTDPTDFH